MERMPCKGCGGTGRDDSQWNESGRCYQCYGAGRFPHPADQAEGLKRLIISSRGASKGTLRASRPVRAPRGADPDTRILHARAYFLWRIARFHGGRDVCMPMCAEMEVEGDPFRDMLDELASGIARKAFGTDMAAAARWGTALGWIDPADVTQGLPDSAYSSGPVADEHKPREEDAELI